MPTARKIVAAIVGLSTRPIVAVPKENAVECEAYRRLVAARPCIFCGVVGFSQAAHPNTRKAKGLKADDRLCFPLCCARLLIVGCHYQFDQHQLFTREAAENFETHWGAVTRAAIVAGGLWPANLPRMAG